MNQKPNLTKSQSAAIDMMIAYMQENNTNHFGGALEGAVNSATHGAGMFAHMCFASTCITSAAHAVATAQANKANAAPAQVTAMPAMAIPHTMTDTSMNGFIGTGAGLAAQTPEEMQGLAAKLNDSRFNEQLTLENLIKLRNQYEK